ncbi:fucose 4-O-acetylase-like acetyltransferase [Rhizomicrobium palustre]|uniref:Fucose 4-O-acetylase-like acetyltransferase n=1 Tax=Rhizomicrobium palustre TaxID=189966 RepID=A0A846N141_9PROT|nr:acyltransferase family protein [Rhizomicrobium palustre]NIK89436.1 fucose 4-O-acetylase-like acetyltransferase [Rhizomicrobium palustre]
MAGQPLKRLDYIDNLRWVVIVLVLGVHAAVTYSHVGSWYYNSDVEPGLFERLIFIAFQASLQSFFMGLMFFLAGYFVPTGYDRKGFGRFMAERLFRLGVPSLIYVFVLHIGMGIFLLNWYGKTDPATAYGLYLDKGQWINGTGPMWFAVALLFFSFVYALLRLVLPKPTTSSSSAAPSLTAILCLGLGMGAVTFLVRQFAPLGTAWHNMQLAYFTQYVVLFALGILARRRGWVEALPPRWGMPVFLTALIGAPLSAIGLVLLSISTHAPQNAFDGGLTWQAAALAFWEQVFCVLFCTGLLILFRDRVNARTNWSRGFSDNGFAVYVIHPPILVGITLAMRPLAWPALAMFAMAWIMALIASFAVAAGLRAVPGVKRIL